METSTSDVAAVQQCDDGFEVDSALVARAMKMSVGHFLSEMRRGNVRGLVEKGEGQDEGRYRLSFRYRRRQLQMIVASDGRLIGQELDLRAR